MDSYILKHLAFGGLDPTLAGAAECPDNDCSAPDTMADAIARTVQTVKVDFILFVFHV